MKKKYKWRRAGGCIIIKVIFEQKVLRIEVAPYFFTSNFKYLKNKLVSIKY